MAPQTGQSTPGAAASLPGLPRDHVWLFHGTTARAADAVTADGWHPPNPHDEVSSFADAHRMDPAELIDEYTTWGGERHVDGGVSCTNGWRRAASYARLAPEYMYFARGKLAQLTQGADYWVEPPAEPSADEPTVLLLAVPWENLDEVLMARGQVELCRSAFLPDKRMWDSLDTLEMLQRGPDEYVLPGHLLQSFLVGVDHVRAQCSCQGSLVLGGSNKGDHRARCPICFQRFNSHQ